MLGWMGWVCLSVGYRVGVVSGWVPGAQGHPPSPLPLSSSLLQVSSKASFELGFNKACALLHLGEVSAAEAELRAALKTGREALLEEECSEEEVAEELAPLSVQLGYALGRQGRTAEAVEIYEQVSGKEGGEGSSIQKGT